ncbi:MAG: PilZ domain-containing protein [Acidobacteriota bacterium]|nr:PilZ domain-containing protein [Acidobacteriota bacterium]
MDQRIHARLPLGLQVRVTDLTAPERSASGDAIDLSESGIGVYLPLQFMPGSSVRLNIKDTVLYGFVAHSCPERSFFRTGIEVVQVLLGASGQSQLLKSMLQEAMPNLKMEYSALP